jgi:NADH:ubiquinone oxidoreductase subunit C
MEEVSLTKIMEENINFQTQCSVIQSEKQKNKEIYKNCICKEKNEHDMIGMHYDGHF